MAGQSGGRKFRTPNCDWLKGALWPRVASLPFYYLSSLHSIDQKKNILCFDFVARNTPYRNHSFIFFRIYPGASRIWGFDWFHLYIVADHVRWNRKLSAVRHNWLPVGNARLGNGYSLRCHLAERGIVSLGEEDEVHRRRQKSKRRKARKSRIKSTRNGSSDTERKVHTEW